MSCGDAPHRRFQQRDRDPESAWLPVSHSDCLKSTRSATSPITGLEAPGAQPATGARSEGS
jgi:hypothetical protein